MPMITTNPLLGDADYITNRYPIIKAFESAIAYVYQDKAKGANSGYATIGVGFLVSANVDEILRGINPDLQTNLGLSDAGFINLATAIRGATAGNGVRSCTETSPCQPTHGSLTC